MKRRVYITGMGALTSLGNSVNEMFSGLLQNRTGVRHIPEWEKYNGLHSHLGAPVAPYDPMVIPRSARRTMSPMSEMAVLATEQALQNAKLSKDELNSPRVLMIMGSTSGSGITLETYFKKLFEKGGPEGQVSTSFFKVMNHSVPANVASAFGFKGSLLSPSSACSTSAQAMILGWELLQTGLYDLVIAGGADELHYMSAAIFDIVLAASRKYNATPEKSPRPFDQDRDGLVVSEGASIVVMESEDSVQRRGAKKLAEFCGGAYLCNGTHMSQSNSSTMMEVMRVALERSNIQASQIEYVNAHATGTQQGDQEEARAIGSVFGSQMPVSSLKGHFGHSLAACGTLEVIASIQMMKHQVIIPTRNLEKVDPECQGVDHVLEVRKKDIRTILSNNFAFGGMNTSLIVSLTEDEE